MRWQGRLRAPESHEDHLRRMVAEAVATMIHVGDPPVSVAAVAQRIGVERSWIYKHFGTDPDAMVEYAAQLYAEAFSDLTRSRESETLEAWCAHMVEATRDGLRDTLAAPWCVQLYFRHRHAADTIGEALRQVEQSYVRAFLKDLPPPLRALPAAESFAEAFLAMRLGAYFRWLDPEVRDAHTEEAFLSELVRPLEAFVASAHQVESRPDGSQKPTSGA